MLDLGLQRHAFSALLAAALFGAATPIAKLLLQNEPPLILAGLLYLGGGTGLALLTLGGRLFLRRQSAEGSLQRNDLPWLVAAIAAGGVAAPALLLWGLSGTSASGASLLLNLEGVLTTLLAAAIFHEAVGRRVGLASLVMLAASLILSYQPQASLMLSPHSLAVALACLLWALDNNLTRRVSHADPVTIATLKGLAAGSVNLALGYATGGVLPPGWSGPASLALGFASYGVSLALYVQALRHLGAARTSAHFSTAPFIGAGLSIALLAEPFTAAFAAALALMGIAAWMVLTENHQHAHTHGALAHSHRHVHDPHHRHSHDTAEGSEPHTHWHVHEPLTHSHPHLPDLHHRHRH